MSESCVRMSNSSFTETQWEREVLEKINSVANRDVRKWCRLVEKMGVSNTTRQQWTDAFIENIEALYKDMLDETNESYQKLLSDIESLLKESSDLCKCLSIKMPQYGADGLSLYEEKKLLETKIKGYKQTISVIKKELEHLKIRQQDICSALGQIPKSIPTSPLPSQEVIDDLRIHLDDLESERYKRSEKFIEVKTLILNLAHDLNYKPNLDFEKIVLAPDDTIFKVTDENMQHLDAFHESLQQLHENMKEEIMANREKLKYFWELLGEDRKTCDEFTDRYSDFNANTLNALKQECHRCEELKRANIKNFVQRLRDQLITLWNKCHFLEDQRNEFDHFNDDLYTEDLLSLHDVEIRKLQQYYNTNRELFMLLDKHQELWGKLLEMERKQAAPDRFHNRGGQLLKEEKQRNTLSKEIPKIESKLLQLAEDYEKENGRPFLSWGKTISNIIETDHENREQEKKIKLSARKQKRDQTLTPAKSMMTLSRCASVQNLKLTQTSTKRKLISTPVPSSSKRKCILGIHTDDNVPRTAPAIYVTSVAPSRYSRERAKRIKTCIKRLSVKYNPSKANTDTTEYASFEAELTNKENLRSTMHDTSDGEMARPLSVTPQRLQHSSQRSKSPNTVAKLTVAAPLKLLF